MISPTGISVSDCGSSSDGIFALGEIIIAILDSGQEQETIRTALNSLADLTTRAVIENNVVTMNISNEEEE